MNIITRKQAKEQGLKYYHTGKVCSRGHIAERQTSNGTCKQCAQDSFNKWYKSEGESYFKDWRDQNKEKISAVNRRQSQREEVKSYRKKYANDHKAEKLFHNRKRKGQLKQASVFPNERQALNEFYKNRPDGQHVDHEIPLVHEKVCGLHCLANLQYLDGPDNLAKSNKWEPT